MTSIGRPERLRSAMARSAYSRRKTSPPRIVRAGSSLPDPANVRADVGVTPRLPPCEPGVSTCSPTADVPDVGTEPRARLRAQLRAEWLLRSPSISSFRFRGIQVQIAFLGREFVLSGGDGVSYRASNKGLRSGAGLLGPREPRRRFDEPRRSLREVGSERVGESGGAKPPV